MMRSPYLMMCGLMLVMGLPPAAQSQAPKFPTGKTEDFSNLNGMWSRGKAEGRGPVKFTHSPMRVEDIDRIIPYGLMVGGHVCPIDHQYYYPKPLKEGAVHFNVFAPADGFVVMIGHRVQLTGSTERKREYDDYALYIEHSGTFYTFYDLLTELDPAILKRLDDTVQQRFAKKAQGPPVHVRIPVKAGQTVGKIAGRSLDVAVINTETRLKGLLTPRMYGHYAWRVHVVDPLDYFEEPLKGKLLKLNLRTAAPRGGKIDYDIDGKLAGNWFKEGSNGYAGTRDPRGYWIGHLAVVYHHLDTEKVIVSLGDYEGRPRQFGVRGNGPDPAKVGKESGPVKYELMNPVSMSLTKPFAGSDNKVQGVLIVEVLDGNKLRVESFPGKSSGEVKGFTKSALIYER